MHYIDDVLSKVLIKEHVGNVIEVMVQRSGTLLYFTTSWHNLLTFYNQPLGAWVKMFYMVQALFKIETVEGRNFGDVRFPMPPTIVHLKPSVEANQVI